MKNKKIIITGGTGFIGQALLKFFGKENDIVILSRQIPNQHSNLYNSKLVTAADGYRVNYVQWNGRDIDTSWAKELDGADIVINLAGKSVNCRYHAKQKKEIIESRVNATHIIGEAIRRSANPPKLWINASTATIYRDTHDKPNDEFTGIISDLKKDNMPYNVIDGIRRKINKTYYDFSIQVAKAWEKAFNEETTPRTRKIAMRTAVTLGVGGVITPYLNLCKFALGGHQGNGKQMYSWVHVEDVARMIEWFYNNEKASGIYNCVAPNAVTNHQFMKTLRSVTGHRMGLPAPALLLEFGSFLIGTESELILKSRWVVPAKAANEGFRFKYEYLDKAFSDIIAAIPRKQYHLF